MDRSLASACCKASAACPRSPEADRSSRGRAGRHAQSRRSSQARTSLDCPCIPATAQLEMSAREELIALRLERAHEEDNPNHGTPCLVIGKSRPWITVDGKQIIMARYMLGIEDAGTKVVAMHTCDNPPCVNADHLREGTQAENVADAWLRGLTKGNTKKVC